MESLNLHSFCGHPFQYLIYSQSFNPNLVKSYITFSTLILSLLHVWIILNVVKTINASHCQLSSSLQIIPSKLLSQHSQIVAKTILLSNLRVCLTSLYRLAVVDLYFCTCVATYLDDDIIRISTFQIPALA